MREEINKITTELFKHWPETGTIVEPIIPGHPIHDAVVKLEFFFPYSRLPSNGRHPWQKLLRASRNGDSAAFRTNATAFIKWMTALLKEVQNK